MVVTGRSHHGPAYLEFCIRNSRLHTSDGATAPVQAAKRFGAITYPVYQTMDHEAQHNRKEEHEQDLGDDGHCYDIHGVPAPSSPQYGTAVAELLSHHNEEIAGLSVHG